MASEGAGAGSKEEERDTECLTGQRKGKSSSPASPPPARLGHGIQLVRLLGAREPLLSPRLLQHASQVRSFALGPRGHCGSSLTAGALRLPIHHQQEGCFHTNTGKAIVLEKTNIRRFVIDAKTEATPAQGSTTWDVPPPQDIHPLPPSHIKETKPRDISALSFQSSEGKSGAGGVPVISLQEWDNSLKKDRFQQRLAKGRHRLLQNLPFPVFLDN